MIAGIFHEGSGLGDQLFRYITVRTLAEEKGYVWNMLDWPNFKGDSFLHLEHGEILDPMLMAINNSPNAFIKGVDRNFGHLWNEKDVRDEFGNDIRSFDPEIDFIEDNTVIDGSFEDSKYWGHNLENINKWLVVEPLNVPEGLCVIGFRGGEYYSDPNLGLSKEYYREALGGGSSSLLPWTDIFQYQIHTDDPALAKEFFSEMFAPHYFNVVENERISHSKHSNMGLNWRSMRYAKYAIIPNSAFFILPRLLKHHEDATAVTIAPRGWSRRNIAKGKNAGDFIWGRPACYYEPFSYI